VENENEGERVSITSPRQPLLRVLLIFNQCPIIVQYSDPGNVFQICQSRKEVTFICNLESINIKASTRLVYIRLSIGCREGLLPSKTLGRYTESISLTGVEEGETVIVLAV
jgi:hypothetical protein